MSMAAVTLIVVANLSADLSWPAVCKQDLEWSEVAQDIAHKVMSQVL